MLNKRDSIAINVMDFGAKGDGVTDDTAAIKLAVKFMCSYAKYLTGTSGFKSYTPPLYFPAGKYVISEKHALNPTTSSLMGYNIRGEGYLVSEILYTYHPSDPSEDCYLMLNGGSGNNWWAFSYVEDLTIRGNNANKFWGVKSQNGAPQANRFRRVFFKELKEAVTVDYGSANVNVDLFRFDSCRAVNIGGVASDGWVFGIKSAQLSQSVAHVFNDCDFESITGKILYFKSGGAIDIRGGSWIVKKNGRVIHCEDSTGTGIGNSNNFYTFYGTKFEYQHRDAADTKKDYAPMVYNSSLAKIKFVNCNFGQFANYGGQFPTYDFFQIYHQGSIEFEGCYLPASVKVRTDVSGAAALSNATPRVVFRNCTLQNQLHDMMTINFTNTPNNRGNNPTVIAEGCITTPDGNPVDVMLFKDFGKRTLVSRTNVYQFSQSTTNALGLPAVITNSENIEKAVKFKLPVGAILKKVRIVFGSSSAAVQFKIDVTNSTRSITFLTATATPNLIPSNDYIAYTSADLFYLIKNESDRIIHVIGSEGTIISGGIPGFVEVEYY